MFLYLSIVSIEKNGCIIVILIWIKINMPDRLTVDKWIKN